MKKKNSAAIPDFSRKKPVAGGKPVPAENSRMPDPRQKQQAPTKAKNGGRRGT